MPIKNDEYKTRKALAKKLESMLMTARDVLYTQDFEDGKINFEIKRKDRKFGHVLRLDVTPFREYTKEKD